MGGAEFLGLPIQNQIKDINHNVQVSSIQSVNYDSDMDVDGQAERKRKRELAISFEKKNVGSSVYVEVNGMCMDDGGATTNHFFIGRS